jgi:hypothetical protein
MKNKTDVAETAAETNTPATAENRKVIPEKPQVDFNTLDATEIPFKNGTQFIEVAKKSATSEGRTNEFVSISRGFYVKDGQDKGKRAYKHSVSLPSGDKDTASKVAKAILEYAGLAG